MKTPFFLLAAFGIAMTARASAESPASSPLIGHWILDVGKLTTPAEARPKRVTLDFGYTKGQQWTTHVEIVDQRESRLYGDSSLSLDGTPGKAVGTYWVDVCAATMPTPRVLVMQFAYKGAPTSTRVYSVSQDGKTLVETEAYFQKDGTPAMRTAFFNRVPGPR